MATQAITAQGLIQGNRAERLAEERNLALLAAQQRARRGPTPEVFFAKRLDNTRLVKAADPVRVREMRTFAAAMAVLFLLVMVYGWQHFSSIEIGYHVESEKQQLEQLNEQNRQLRLTEAQLGDPVRIDQMARQLGLDAPKPGQVVRPSSVIDPNAPALAEAQPVLPMR
jgi:cell division protein FtsL